MRVDKIELSNFRGLSQEGKAFKAQSFDPNFNVIIGVNGIGKTSILDAIAVLLTRVLPRSTPAKSGYRRFLKTDVRANATSSTLSAKLSLKFGELNLEYSFSESFGAMPAINEDHLRSHFKAIAEKFDAKNTASKIGVPIALFFTTDRAAFRLPKKSLRAAPTGRSAAYHGALRDKFVNYRSFITWLRTRKALATEREDDLRMLTAVDTALRRFLPAFGELEGTDDPPRLYLKKGGIRLGIEQLSDGERSFLAMVVDITRHLAQANPASKNPLEEGEGVVMIDELELHLHPKWQGNIVEHLQATFPKLQFITTTHSPFVIQSLRDGQLINFDSEEHREEFANQSIEDIVEFVMGLPLPQKSRRHLEMVAAAKEYYSTLQKIPVAAPEQVSPLKERLDEVAKPYRDDAAFVAFLEFQREVKLKEHATD